MKKYLAFSLFLVLTLPITAMAHPLKLTASLVEYDVTSKSVNVECKVFRDDFQSSLKKSVLQGVDKQDITRDGKIKIIEAYFKKHYSIIHNGSILPMRLQSSRFIRGQNVVVMRFKINPVTLKEGDNLIIKNALFFEDFGYAQSNRIVIRIPSFSIDDQHVATMDKPIKRFTLGALTR